LAQVLQFVEAFVIRPRRRKPITGEETLGDLRIDKYSYDLFKQRAYEIVQSKAIDEIILTHFIVTFTLQALFEMGDLTKSDEVIATNTRFIEYLRDKVEQDPEDISRVKRLISDTENHIHELPRRIQGYRKLYEYFRENVVEALLAEEYTKV
jgi:hypothetical protein